MAKVSVSLLSADFTHMAEDAKRMIECGTDWLHCDVMDGSFVPNITFGPQMIRDLRKNLGPDAFLDVHLMIEKPERYVEEFAAAGASLICVHQEATVHLQRTLQAIRNCGVKAGVALNPATSEMTLEYVYDVADLVLCMTVNPGFGGQKMLPIVAEKVRKIDQRRKELGLSFEIEVDGGVSTENSKMFRDAGTTVLVSGNSVFKAPDVAAAIRGIRGE